MAAGTAHARGHADVQWSVTLGSPGTVLGLPLPPVPMIERNVIVQQPAPVYYPDYRPAPRRGYGWRDRDHDGIPNRYDRVDNRRWDRYDHDGRWDDRRDDRDGRHHGPRR